MHNWLKPPGGGILHFSLTSLWGLHILTCRINYTVSLDAFTFYFKTQRYVSKHRTKNKWSLWVFHPSSKRLNYWRSHSTAVPNAQSFIGVWFFFLNCVNKSNNDNIFEDDFDWFWVWLIRYWQNRLKTIRKRQQTA